MRIASKINTALLAVFACGSLAGFVVLETVIQPRFDALEQAAAYRNHNRVTEAFSTFTEKLQAVARDYAFWDETYGFVQGENHAEFIESNLTPEFKAVENLGVNALLFQASDGKVVWGAAYDLDSGDMIPAMIEEIAQFSQKVHYTDAPGVLAERGMLRTERGLILVAVSPVLRSDRSGPSVGKVVSAKLLDLDAVKKLTHVEFSLEEASADAIKQEAEMPVMLRIAGDKVETSSVVNDILGTPIAILKVASGRDISALGSNAIRSAVLLMVLAGLAAMAVLWAFLKLSVVHRIEALKTHFETAGVRGKIRQAGLAAGKDEIGDLARAFNTMADQVNYLRDALADSAYMSGLSEWAAGTLHNVRNGMAPVTAGAWQIEKLYDKSWVENIEAAALEYEGRDTEPERRQKLNAYLVGSVKGLVASAKHTAGIVQGVKDASKSVLEMMSEFERYAHRKTEIEDVDLLPLIQTCVGSVSGRTAKSIDVVLPKATALVKGNGVILRQVVSNVLINAIEAMEFRDSGGRIEVAFTAKDVEPGFTEIRFTDNGEGLRADQLESIFKRGVSTRSHRTGGLGLHWCANAVAVLGGKIRMESSGPGLGATVVIVLPNFEATTMEAA